MLENSCKRAFPLSLSAAFDTVDNDILLNRLSTITSLASGALLYIGLRLRSLIDLICFIPASRNFEDSLQDQFTAIKSILKSPTTITSLYVLTDMFISFSKDIELRI